MGSHPADVDVLVGGDVGKTEHHATAIDLAGGTLVLAVARDRVCRSPTSQGW